MPIALDNGIGIDEFEERTFAEINLMLESKARVRENELRNELSIKYQMVDLMGASIGRMFAEGVEFPEIYQIYPELFEDVESIREEQKAQAKMELEAAKWKLWAANHNRQFAEKG